MDLLRVFSWIFAEEEWLGLGRIELLSAHDEVSWEVVARLGWISRIKENAELSREQAWLTAFRKVGQRFESRAKYLGTSSMRGPPYNSELPVRSQQYAKTSKNILKRKIN